MYHALAETLWSLSSPTVAIPLLLGIGLVMLWTRWRRAGRWLVTLTAATVILLSVFHVSDRLARALEERFPQRALPADVTGIVVLGGSIQIDPSRTRDQAMLNRNGDRLVQFAALSRRYPHARLVFTGGGIRGGVQDEADLSARALADMGVDVGRVEFERRSTSTHENAVFTRELVRPQPGDVWLLVTSAWHMPRAVGSFRAAGWDVIPYSAGYATAGPGRVISLPGHVVEELVELTSFGREWLSLIAYRYLGWTDALFPAPKPEAAH